MNKSGLYSMFIMVRRHKKLQGVGRHGCCQWV